MAESICQLRGANMDVDIIPTPGLKWEQDACPWNEAEGSSAHKCAVKNTSLCRYFRGIKFPDTVLCAYPSTT
jgi:hypothetical protein